MSYYGQGDYYATGGVFSFVSRVARELVPGPVRAAATAASSLFAGPRPQQRLPTIDLPGTGAPGFKMGPVQSPRFAAAAAQGGRFFTKDGRPRRIRKDGRPWKRPTMDPGNVRALNRAVRRTERFVAIARKALSSTRYKVASRGSSSRSRRK